MSTTARSWTGRLLGPAVLLFLGGCGEEARYPDQPLFLLCPWGAGGGTDRVSRRIADLLGKELGQTVNVINATGGQGVTGHSRGALARPDGYTLTMMTVELNMLHWRGLTKITHENFAPIVLLNRDSSALFVRADAPWKTLKDLEDHIKSSPEALKASGTAQGGIWHLGLAGWYTAIGKDPGDVNWLSSKGAAPSMGELLSGTIDVVSCSLPEARIQLEAGEVRCLGVMADERVLPKFPDVPTFKEQGYGWSLGAWRGIGVPRDTPREVLDTLVPALERVVKSDVFRGYMAKEGFNWQYEGPNAFRKSLIATDETMKELIQSDAFAAIRESRYSPILYPAVLGIAFVGVLIGLVATRTGTKEVAVRPTATGWIHFLEAVGVVVAFLVLVRPVGFLLTASTLLGLLAWRLGTKPWVAALVAVVLVPALYAIFKVQLGVDLPRGVLGW